ncbi:MAG: DUF1036 domain-containing protein [Roseovarius sp.]
MALSALPGAALAGLTICNDTSQQHSVAIGYKSGDQWISEGWWNIAPGACAEPVTGDLQSRYYYFRATAPGRSFPGEGYMFCTEQAAFTITGDADCVARGYESSDFAMIDTGTSALSHTHRIVEPKGKDTSGKQQAANTAPAAPAAPASPSGTIFRSGLGRGEHGEPFTNRLGFQGCDFFDGFEACVFIGDGWKYMAAFDDPTPSGFLEQFYTTPLGVPMVVTGDLVSYEGRTAQLAVSEIEVLAGADTYAPQRQAMQGSWVSADDPNEELYIQGLEMHQYFGKEYSDSFLLEIAPDCAESAGTGPVIVQTSVTYGDEYCYRIDNLSGGWMDLILMGHEAMVSYRKVE